MPTDFAIGSVVYPGLSKLMEECGEVLQVLGKIIAAHKCGLPENMHWDGTNLRERIHDELADLAAAVNFFGSMNSLQDSAYRERVNKKLDLFCQWHNLQGRAV
jgi:NTP pyrophosphatase (non-canonical NTP hydrolase)